jgi:hypothetical protein
MQASCGRHTRCNHLQIDPGATRHPWPASPLQRRLATGDQLSSAPPAARRQCRPACRSTCPLVHRFFLTAVLGKRHTNHCANLCLCPRLASPQTLPALHRLHAPAMAMACPQQTQARRALVVYGSETGNAQDVAEEMGRLAVRLRFDTDVAELDAITLVRWAMKTFACTGVDVYRNNSCSTMSFSWLLPPVARANCRQIVRHSGGLSAVHGSAQGACSR